MPQPQKTPTPDISEQFLVEKLQVGRPWRILLTGFLVFVLSLFVYVGLHFGYGPYLESQAQDLDNQIQALGERVSAEEQERFLNFYSQLMNLKRVLSEHYLTSNFFTFLEKNTVEKVYFNSVSLNASQGTASLQGGAADLQSLAEQILVFEKSPQVVSVSLDTIYYTFGSKGLSFSLSLVVKKDLFKPAL